MPKLLVSLADGSKSHDLNEATITLGRVSDNTLQIEHPSVSSYHAQLTLGEGGDYVLRDLGSTNGTLLNGKEIAEGEDHRLQDGDKVVFGEISTSYASESPADARPLPQAEEVAAVVADTSARPSDFANASPFQKKKKKKDTVGMAIILTAVVSALAFGGALYLIYGIKSPL
jgi:pSer/pThr/pTyr-binding forkhead associated (FHA) protein